jgi:hypothetical protein
MFPKGAVLLCNKSCVFGERIYKKSFKIAPKFCFKSKKVHRNSESKYGRMVWLATGQEAMLPLGTWWACHYAILQSKPSVHCGLIKIVKERVSSSFPHYVIRHILLNSGRVIIWSSYFAVIQRLQLMLSQGTEYWLWKRSNVRRFYTLPVRRRELGFSL